MPESPSDHGSESDVNPVQDSFLWRICSAASGSQAAFCCGGHVTITPDPAFEKIKDDLTDRRLTSTPVVIRWDRNDGKTTSKLTLPIAHEKETSVVPPRSRGRPRKKREVGSDDDGTRNQAALQDLLNDCAPASFGKDGKDVLDDSYRKAVKLDPNQFSTNFNPYDVGIIGAIAQTLLPGIAKPITNKAKGPTFAECLGVIAELYKLNVGTTPYSHTGNSTDL
ncbi:MAG: hypothetical protein Q9221_002967 [Calogaya cf. arnoldii]